MDVQPQGCLAAPYRSRRPAKTHLYGVVQNHLETCLSRGYGAIKLGPTTGSPSDPG